jgi:hypothetical protein
MLGVYAAASWLTSSKVPPSPEFLRPTSLSLTLTAIAKPEYRRQAAGSNLDQGVGAPTLLIPPVFLINTSIDRPLAVRIYLAITDELGVRHRLEAERNDERIGQMVSGTSPNEFVDESQPQWILSPSTIEPSSALDGPIPFVLTSSGAKPSMDALADRLSADYLRGHPPGESFKYALELQDTVSGLAISIPLPSDGYLAS